MSLYILKPKAENKKITQDYLIGTEKNVKVVQKLKKNQQSKSKFFTFLFEGIYIYVSASFSISANFRMQIFIILFALIA